MRDQTAAYMQSASDTMKALACSDLRPRMASREPRTPSRSTMRASQLAIAFFSTNFRDFAICKPGLRCLNSVCQTFNTADHGMESELQRAKPGFRTGLYLG